MEPGSIHSEPGSFLADSDPFFGQANKQHCEHVDMPKELDGFDVTDQQNEYIRFFAERVNAGNPRINCQEFCERFNLQGDHQHAFWNALRPMQHLGVYDPAGGDNCSTVVLPYAAQAIKKLDAPPPMRHYLDEWTAWWFNNPWLSAITVVEIVLPLIWSWCQMIAGWRVGLTIETGHSG
jgi:hypothetical protein